MNLPILALAGFCRLGRARLVDRHARQAPRGILIRPQPGESLADLGILLGQAGELEGVQDQTGGIAIGRCDRGLDLAVRKVAERTEAPAAAGLLLGEDLLDELFLFLSVNKSVHSR